VWSCANWLITPPRLVELCDRSVVLSVSSITYEHVNGRRPNMAQAWATGNPLEAICFSLSFTLRDAYFTWYMFTNHSATLQRLGVVFALWPLLLINVVTGADVNFTEDRLSALHIAACKGQTGIAKLLIINKCNINILTRFRLMNNYSRWQHEQTSIGKCLRDSFSWYDQ